MKNNENRLIEDYIPINQIDELKMGSMRNKMKLRFSRFRAQITEDSKLNKLIISYHKNKK